MYSKETTRELQTLTAEFIKKQKAEGIKRKLVGFEIIGRGIPRHDYQIKDAQGNVIGKVTSGTMSPVLGVGVGLGYVTTENANPDTEIFIDVRGKNLKAKVSKLPLINK